MANSYTPISDDPGLIAKYQALINGDPPPQPPQLPAGPGAFASRITDPQTYMPRPVNDVAPFDSGTPAPQVGMYPQGFNPRANPNQFASTDPGQSLLDARNNMYNAVSQVPVLGGIQEMAQGMANRSPISTLMGQNPDVAGLTQGTPEYRSAMGQSMAAGIIGPESGAGKAASAGDRFAVRQVSGAKSFEVFDAGTGKNVGGVVHSTEDAALARADRPNVSATPSPAEAAAVFGDPRRVGIANAARDVPEVVQSFVRKGIRDGTLTPEQFLATPNAQTMVDGLLTKYHVPLSDATRQGAVTELFNNSDLRNVGGAAKNAAAKAAATAAAKVGLPETLNAETLSQRMGIPNTPAQQAQNGALGRALAGRRAAAPPVEAGVVPPGSTAAVSASDMMNAHATLADKLRAERVSEADIKAFQGKNYSPPGVAPLETTASAPAFPPKLPAVIPPDSPFVQAATKAGPDGAAALTRATDLSNQMIQNPLFSAKELGPRSFAGPGALAKAALGVFNQVVYNGIVLVNTVFLHPFGSAIASVGGGLPEHLALAGFDKFQNSIGHLTGGKIGTLERTQTVDAAWHAFHDQATTIGAALYHDLPGAVIHGTNAIIDRDSPASVGAALFNGEFGSNVGLKAAGLVTQALSAANIPMNTLAGIDNAMAKGNTAFILKNRARVAGTNAGLAGQALEDFATNALKTASQAQIVAAQDAAQTKMNRQAPGLIAGKPLTVKAGAGPLGTALLPFFNTRLNVLKAATSWSPLGFARLLPDSTPVLGHFAERTITDAERVQAVFRAGVGTLAIKPLSDFMASDNITGDGPTDPKEKAQWLGDPNNPSHVARSLRTPLGWVTYGKVPAFGDFVAAIADVYQAVKDNKAPDVSGAQAAVLGLQQYFANEEKGLENAMLTLQAFKVSVFDKPSDKQAQAILAQHLASRGFEITPYSGLIRGDAALNDPNYKGIPKGTTGVWNEFAQNYRAQFPSNFPVGNTAELPNSTARVPGVTGGFGSFLPVHVAPAGPPSPMGTAAGLPPTASVESERLAAAVTTFKPLGLPADKIGVGSPNELKLSGDQYLTFSRMVGEQRNTEINALLLKPDYQNASDAVRAKMFTAAVDRANRSGEQNYLRNGVLTSTDPAMIKQEAVLSVHALTSDRDKAQWISLMDRSGKLTPEVRAAIDAATPVTVPGQPPPPTIAEYLRAAPLITKYLSIPPYVIGNAQEWAALTQARRNEARALATIKQTATNVPASVTTQMARQQLSPQDTQLLYKYASSGIVNPLRRQMLTQYQFLGRYLSATGQTQVP